jgi:hypothetical protein
MLDHIDLKTRKPRNSVVDNDALLVAIRGGGVPDPLNPEAGTFVTGFSPTTASFQVVPPRINRASMMLFNDSDQPVLIRLGTAPCTVTDHSMRINAGALLTMSLGEFNGALQACWVTPASGTFRVTEVV